MKDNNQPLEAAVRELLYELRDQVAVGPRDIYPQKVAMAMLGVKRTTFYHLRKSGRLEWIQIGKKVLITKEAIDRLIRGSTQTSAPTP
jgi:excisionase family DNA binding protein